jgi:hypothetical protein
VPALIHAEHCPAMGAAVDEHLHRALGVPHHDHRGVADALGFIIARGRGLDLQPDPVPGVPPEDPFLFVRIQGWVGKDLIGHPADAQRRPL